MWCLVPGSLEVYAVSLASPPFPVELQVQMRIPHWRAARAHRHAYYWWVLRRSARARALMPSITLVLASA